MPATAKSSTPFRLTGLHVLMAILGFFAVTIAVNSVFIFLALDTFTGVESDHAYTEGLNYNDEIARREAQKSLDWRAELSHAWAKDGGQLTLSFSLIDKADEPVSSLAFVGRLRHPTDTALDRPITFHETGIGIYSVEVADVPPGAWDIEIRSDPAATSATVDSTSVQIFKAKKRIWLR